MHIDLEIEMEKGWSDDFTDAIDEHATTSHGRVKALATAAREAGLSF